MLGRLCLQAMKGDAMNIKRRLLMLAFARGPNTFNRRSEAVRT